MAERPSKTNEEYSTTELFSSAKLVAEAAQSTFSNESDKVDKTKVAGAAGDLLDAAGQYAKLDDQKGIGQYVDKAADYLHNYQGGSTTGPPSKSSESDPPKHESQGGGDAPQSGSGGGFGQFAKLAGDFMKKN